MIKVLRRRGKDGHLFRFDLTVHGAEARGAALSEHWSPEGKMFALVWTHGSHRETTRPVRLTASDVTWEEELSLTGTLYKRPDDTHYDEKMYRLRLREVGGKRIKTRGELNIDFSPLVAASPYRGGFRSRLFVMDVDSKKLAHCALEISLSWVRLSKRTGLPIPPGSAGSSLTGSTEFSILSTSSSGDASDTSDSSRDDDDDSLSGISNDAYGSLGDVGGAERHRRARMARSMDPMGVSAPVLRLVGSKSPAPHSAADGAVLTEELRALGPDARARALESRAHAAAKAARAARSWSQALSLGLGYALVLPLTLTCVAAWTVALGPSAPGAETLAGAPLRAAAAAVVAVVSWGWALGLWTLLAAAAVPGSVAWSLALLCVLSLMAAHGSAYATEGPYDALGLPTLRGRAFAAALALAASVDTVACAAVVYVAATLVRLPALLPLLVGAPNPESHYAVDALVLVGTATVDVATLPLYGVLLAAPWRLATLPLPAPPATLCTTILAAAVDWLAFALAFTVSLPMLSTFRLVAKLRDAGSPDARAAAALSHVGELAGTVTRVLLQSNPVGRAVSSAGAKVVGVIAGGANTVGGIVVPPLANGAGSVASLASSGTGVFTTGGTVVVATLVAVLAATPTVALAAVASLVGWLVTGAVSPVTAVASAAASTAAASSATLASLVVPLAGPWTKLLGSATKMAAVMAARGSPTAAHLVHIVAVALWIAVPLVLAVLVLPASIPLQIATVVLHTFLLRAAPATIHSAWHTTASPAGHISDPTRASG